MHPAAATLAYYRKGDQSVLLIASLAFDRCRLGFVESNDELLRDLVENRAEELTRAASTVSPEQ